MVVAANGPTKAPAAEIVAPGESTTKHMSATVRPVSTPPPRRIPDANRLLTVNEKKSFTVVCFPKFEAATTRLLTTPNLAGAMSYRPHTWYPPPSGSRESTGAVMQYGL